MKHDKIDFESFPKPLMAVLSLVAGAALFKAVNQLHADYDLWWHLFIGSRIIEQGALDLTDIYSFTAFGRPYINHEWASEILMAFAYLKGGDLGLLIWRWGMVTMILFFAFKRIIEGAVHPFSRILLVLCFAAVIGPGISFRVQLLSYGFLLLLHQIIGPAEKKISLPSMVLIPAFFILWANMHGGFILGLIVWFVYIGERIFLQTTPRRLTMILFSGLPVAATLINPFGWDLWHFIYTELTNPLSSRFITEWQPFSFAPRELPFFTVMVLTWTCYFFSDRAKGFSETLLLLLASVMGLKAVRNTPLFVLVALPAMVRHMDGACVRLLKQARRGPPSSPALVYTIVILLAGLSAVLFWRGLPDGWKVHIGKDPLPVQTVAFLKENRLKANLWVPLHYGGYVMYHLYPDIRVSIDGRWAMVYPREVMADTMTFSYNGGGGKWKKLLDKYGAHLALVEPDNPAVREMIQDPDWVWLFKESGCSLLARRDYLPTVLSPFKKPEKKEPVFP